MSHKTVTGRSRDGHGTVTGRSRYSNGTVTGRSRDGNGNAEKTKDQLYFFFKFFSFFQND
jgi:hypothetical protein